jgi:hypothetical protein
MVSVLWAAEGQVRKANGFIASDLGVIGALVIVGFSSRAH